MSDYFNNGGYDAGAVVDMNNLAIGYFPRTPWQCHPTVIAQAPIQPQVPQQPIPAVPSAKSGTTS